MPPDVVVVMGVAGAGKTTVGRLLAHELGWSFADADAYHSPDAWAKMARGEPLTDADRAPWLARLRAVISEHRATNTPLVLACSDHAYGRMRRVRMRASKSTPGSSGAM